MATQQGTDGLTARGRAMQRVLARWERSGLSLAAFARQARIPAGTLGWWRHVLRGRGRPAVAAEAFVELPVPCAMPGAPARPAAPRFEVVCRDGTRVRVPAAFDAAALARLLAVVDGRRGC